MATMDLLKSCRQIPGLSVFTAMVTPHVADLLLKMNTHNRKLSPTVVSRYAHEMKNDEWMMSASGVGIDRNNIIVDGQHRLHAIVESGTTVPLLIVYGLAPASQEKIDRQKKRSLFDVFHLAGCATKPKEVQIATFLTAWNGRKDWAHAGSMADSEVKKTLECHRQSIGAILELSSFQDKGFGRIGFLSASVLYHELSPAKALSFVTSVLTGEMLTLDDPCMKLRKFLLGEVSYTKVLPHNRGGSAQFADFRRTVSAINAYHAGRKLTILRETEEFNLGD